MWDLAVTVVTVRSRTCVPDLSCDYFSESCSAEASKQNRHPTKMYVVHHTSG